MKKPIIPFFLFAGIAVLLIGSTLSAQDPVTAAQNEESDKKVAGFKSRLIDFNEIQNSSNKFLKVRNWDVELNSSSAYISNIMRSYAKPAINKSKSRYFLGIRGNFPTIEANSYVTVKPRYEISFYDKNSLPIVRPNKRGVVPNVGVLREARVRVGGRNYKHKFLVKMLKSTGEVFNIDFGSLLFSGWKELVWKNPYFLDDYRHQKSELTPLYPRIVSALKFESIIILRERLNSDPGDFIAYVDYIDVFYNKASLHDEFEENPENAIDDEGTWDIIKNEVAGPNSVLLRQKLRNFQCLERIEKMKRNIPLTDEEKSYNPCSHEEGSSAETSEESVDANTNDGTNNVTPIFDQQQTDNAGEQQPAAGENQ